MTNNLDIIKGLDGYYIIQKGKLIRIINAIYSKDYFAFTNGWVEYKLENGIIIRLG
jgi:hypothetical protein